MKTLYVLCDCDSDRGPKHYYTGERCPYSGWIAPFVEEASRVAVAVTKSGKPLTVEMLAENGISPDALSHVMIAEFPDRATVPYALGLDSFGSE
jgi:hypothetical protein